MSNKSEKLKFRKYYILHRGTKMLVNGVCLFKKKTRQILKAYCTICRHRKPLRFLKPDSLDELEEENKQRLSSKDNIHE